jgi:hypothetical protein
MKKLDSVYLRVLRVLLRALTFTRKELTVADVVSLPLYSGTLKTEKAH